MSRVDTRVLAAVRLPVPAVPGALRHVAQVARVGALGPQPRVHAVPRARLRQRGQQRREPLLLRGGSLAAVAPRDVHILLHVLALRLPALGQEGGELQLQADE